MKLPYLITNLEIRAVAPLVNPKERVLATLTCEVLCTTRGKL